MQLSPDFVDHLMKLALEQASLAYELGEVPVGAVIAHQDRIISSAHNGMEREKKATAHAEIRAIESASEALKNWRLSECVLCVTLEPCTMCAGAIRLARIPIVVFAAHDERAGAFGSIYDLSEDPRLGDPLRVIAGVQEEESREMLQRFFRERR